MYSHRIIEEAIRLDVIEEDSRELYEFAFANLFFSSLTWGVLILIGIISKQVVGSIVFMVFYIPLRLFCGGLHMPNRELCLLTSLLIYILMFGLAAIEVYEALLYKTLVTASIPIIALLAPVETRNKPILLDEAKRNKKISLLLLSAALFGLSILHALRLDILFYFASFSLILLSVLMLLGAVINRRHTRGPCA